MIALEEDQIDYEQLLKYPIQVPRTKIISNIVTGVVDLHFSHKKIIFSDSTEEPQGKIRELLNQTKVKCKAFKLYFHSIKWIGVTNLDNEGKGKRNYATLYLYDYSVIYFEALHLLPLFERLWSSQLLLEVRGVKRLTQSPRKDSSRYFQCVVDDLLNPSAMPIDKMFYILDEFAGEVALDLTLKNLCFERTELFIVCVNLIKVFLQLEVNNFSFVNDHALRQVFPPDLSRQIQTQAVHSEETQRKKMILATKRLGRIIAVLETVCAIFYASDTCTSSMRRSFLLRDSPLGLSVWVPLLATDLAMEQLVILGSIPSLRSISNSPDKPPSAMNVSQTEVTMESWAPPYEDADFDKARQRCRNLQLLLLYQLDGISELTRALYGGNDASSSATDSGSTSVASAHSFSGSNTVSSTAGGLFPVAVFSRRPRLGHRAGFLGLSSIQRKMSNTVVPLGGDSGSSGGVNAGTQLTAKLKGTSHLATAEALQWSCVAEALCAGGIVSVEVWESAIESFLSLVVQSLNSLSRRLKLRRDNNPLDISEGVHCGDIDSSPQDIVETEERRGSKNNTTKEDAEVILDPPYEKQSSAVSFQPKPSATEPTLAPRLKIDTTDNMYTEQDDIDYVDDDSEDDLVHTSRRISPSLLQRGKSRLTILTTPHSYLHSHTGGSMLIRAATQRWETQLRGALSEEGVVEEVLTLFCASSLLHSLAADSAVVRDTLHMHERGGSSSALRAALGMLQTLCPRVNRPTLLSLQQPEHSSAPPVHLQPNNFYISGKHTPADKSIKNNNNNINSKSFGSAPPTMSITSLMGGVRGSVTGGVTAPPARTQPHTKVFVCEACVVDEFTPSSALATAEVEIQAFLAPYEERWQLLVTSRLNLEDCTRLALLSLPASFTAVRPITDML